MKLLLVTSSDWLHGARFAMICRQAGFGLDVVCARDHPIMSLRQPPVRHRQGLFGDVQSVRHAISIGRPDFVVPLDDHARLVLHEIHRLAPKGDQASVIERSLGEPRFFDILERKSEILQVANELGIATPRSCFLRRQEDFLEHALAFGFPCVMARDGTSGGAGIRFVNHREDLLDAWKMFSKPRSVARFVRLAISKGIGSAIRDPLSRPGAICVQEHIRGTPANRAVLCHEGKVLGGISVLARETYGAAGPASVVEVIDNPEITEATAAIVSRLGISGFCGLDFIVSEESGRAVFLEVNARPTAAGILGFRGATTLPEKFSRFLRHENIVDDSPGLIGRQVVLFPTELLRDPRSEHLHSLRHDVPWTEIRLVERGLAQVARIAFRQKIKALASFGGLGKQTPEPAKHFEANEL